MRSFTLLAATAAFGATVVIGGAALAQDAPAALTSSAPTAAASTDIVDPDDKIVCRSVRVTGTRMSTRQCETVGERKRRREDERTRQVKNDSKYPANGLKLPEGPGFGGAIR